MGQKLSGGCALFSGGAGSPSNTKSPGWSLPPYQVACWCSQTFGHNRNRPKIGGRLCPLFEEGDLSPHLKVAWAEAYVHTKWHLNLSNRLATTDMGRKLGTLSLWEGRVGSSSNTMWPGSMPTCVPSFINNVTDRQDNGPIAWGEPFYKRSPKTKTGFSFSFW